MEDKIERLIELFKAMETHQEIMIGNPKAYREVIEQLIARNKELEEENKRLKCSISKANKIIDEYANEIEDDTKK